MSIFLANQKNKATGWMIGSTVSNSREISHKNRDIRVIIFCFMYYYIFC